jgi:hypothetical protein
MEEELRRLQFECRGCWHVWDEEYLVRQGDDGRGHQREMWLHDGVRVAPPSAAATCPACGSAQVTTFPEGYLDRHPEARRIGEPAVPDESRLLSPVPKHLI